MKLSHNAFQDVQRNLEKRLKEALEKDDKDHWNKYLSAVNKADALIKKQGVQCQSCRLNRH